MKLTIIPADKAVYKNGKCFINLSLSNIPTNVHALQWSDVSGWIEYIDVSNEAITELPQWALDALSVWETTEVEINTPKPPTQEELKAPHLNYLISTDWYVVRFMENGTPIPTDILAARQAARDAIV